jgi:3-hydroxymyristoyl/3-hydroxydecanoyl-(acyl carrier protein) dehydratase
MQKPLSEDPLGNYLEWWDGHLRQAREVHQDFLEMRLAELRQQAGSIQQQIPAGRRPDSGAVPPLFNHDDLNEFAIGSVAKCLGPEYAVYAGRRCSRIPNRELLLMSRILSIQGQKGEFEQPASIVAEYDVPANPWYLEGEPDGHLPYSICIEIALQPCGFLSAYLGTSLRFPDVDYYFRNLDGETVLHRIEDARGKTVRTRAELLRTVYYGSTIIQHFSFEISRGGEVFFAGKSSFGYFSAEAMAGQVGLDGGKSVLPWLIRTGQENRIVPLEGTTLEAELPKGRLRLLDGVAMDREMSDHAEGYVYAHRRNQPDDWFYRCHFHEDPVMPGSLGIEAIFQAMKVFALQQATNPASVVLVAGQKMNWRYRGQVLQHHQQMQLEVFFRKTQSPGKRRLFTGDASLWADDSRIYQVQNLAIALVEADGRYTGSSSD